MNRGGQAAHRKPLPSELKLVSKARNAVFGKGAPAAKDCLPLRHCSLFPYLRVVHLVPCVCQSVRTHRTGVGPGFGSARFVRLFLRGKSLYLISLFIKQLSPDLVSP